MVMYFVKPSRRILPLLLSGLLAASSGLAQTNAVSAPEETAIAQAPEFESALSQYESDMSESRRSAIAGFYASRNFEPYWNANDGRNLLILRQALNEVEAQALPADRYVAEQLVTSDGFDTEIAATDLMLQLSGDLSAGILKPVSIDPEMVVETSRVADVEILSRLETAGVAKTLRLAEPQDPEYRTLIAEGERLKGLLNSDAWGAEVADGPTLREGDFGIRVSGLRERLARLGYGRLPPADSNGSEQFFDSTLTAWVKQFQTDFGLVDDGAVGGRTLQTLNSSPRDRLKQVMVNLERMRWMNHDLGERRIMANIPDFTVTLFDNDTPVWHSRSIVGKTDDTRTPEFSDVMTYMVVNPTWHIPDSIATRVYLPKLRNDPTVLARSGMSLFTRSGQKINPRLVNFNQYTAENFPFRVKQNPSSSNALGRVKFMFPNQFSIYLHDTPTRSLFNKDARAFSNGCVRLEQPVELAYALLEQQYSNPADAFAGWLRAKSERHVNLEQPVQVHLVYRTAWADDAGNIQYRSDIYGRDRKVFAALVAKGVGIPEPAQG